MKILINFIFTLILVLPFYGCEENIPRGRPSILDQESAVITGEEGVEPKTNEAVIRPSGAVIINPDYCGCKDGKPVTLGDCTNVCSEKQVTSDPVEKLYFNVNLTEAITLDQYEDVFGWCTKEIEDAEGNLVTGTGCYIEAKDEKGNIEKLSFAPEIGKRDFSINLSSLSFDKTYRLTIVEGTSLARSTTFQVRKFTNLIENKVTGPLQLIPVNRYTCMIRKFEAIPNSNTTALSDINRFHLYFTSESRPEPLLEQTVSSFYCHDIETFGTTPINSPLLEETIGAFTLWYKDDPRFFDLDKNGFEDVNQLIEQEVNLQGATLSQTPKLFSQLVWMSALDDGNQSADGSNNNQSNQVDVKSSALGYYMSPFLDEDTFKAYCPKEEHYYSSSPLFKAMREIVGIKTEALYVAKEDNVCNFILINESVVSKVWFYKENGNHIAPNSDTIKGKQIQFYWPADPTSPYIKKSHQRVYTIKTTDELNSSCDTSVSSSNAADSTLRTEIPPHDKRIGCVPVMSQ